MKTATKTARDVMSSRVVSVPPSMTLHEAAAVLRTHRITGAAVVTDTGRVIGVLSETDLVDREAQVRARHGTVTVGDVFSPYVITARADASIRALAGLMVRHRVHRVFILDGTALVGVATSMDVMRAVATSRAPAKGVKATT